MMPISDPRDRFFYLHHTPMKDTCNLTPVISGILQQMHDRYGISASTPIVLSHLCILFFQIFGL